MKPAVLEDNVWIEDAVATIGQLSRDLPEFTADDLRKEMRAPANTNWPGLAFGQAKRQGLIEKVREGTSKARPRNSGALKVWTRAKEEL